MLAMQCRNHRIREFHFIHLKRGLSTQDVTWIRGLPSGSPAVPDETERSGLDAQTQRALAGIRTDLDSFSENECHALMFAGYRMTCRDFVKSKYFGAGAATEKWKFLGVGALMDETRASKADRSFVEELECGRHLFFRRVRLSWAGRAYKGLRGMIWSKPET
jgi:hypothetical protein